MAQRGHDIIFFERDVSYYARHRDLTRDLVHWNALHSAMLETYGVDATIEEIAYHGMTDVGILCATLTRAGVSGGVFESKLPFALEIVCREVARNAKEIDAVVCASISDVLSRLHDGRTRNHISCATSCFTCSRASDRLLRLFEAAACGSAIISDQWKGLETFFAPGDQILVAQTTEQVQSTCRT